MVMQCWLRCRTEYYRDAVMCDHLAQDIENCCQQMCRQHLYFVQNDDTPCDVMQLSASASSMCHQAFKKLYSGGHDQASIPVFGCQPAPHLLSGRVVGIFRWRNTAMVFEDYFLFGKNPPKLTSSLFCNAHIGNGIDYSL